MLELWSRLAAGVYAAASPAASATPDFWSYITATGVETYVGVGGGLTLAALFATNRIMTIWQHRSRIEDLEKYHATVLGQWETRYAEMKESRDYYRNARLEEKDRADKATGQLVEMSEIANTAVAALTALERTAQAVAK